MVETQAQHERHPLLGGLSWVRSPFLYHTKNYYDNIIIINIIHESCLSLPIDNYIYYHAALRLID